MTEQEKELQEEVRPAEETAKTETAETETESIETEKAEKETETSETETAETETEAIETDTTDIETETVEAVSEDSTASADDQNTAEEKKPEFDPDKAEGIIEAILFTMGETVEISKLAETLGTDVKTVKKVLKKMDERYAAQDRGIMLAQFDSAVQLCTKPEMYEYLIRIAKTPKKLTLSDTVIETLSIIAYKQPVTRLDVEGVRGVNCDYAINKLLEYGLITELGRLDAPGKPILFGTTEQFLRCFGVKSLEELPELSTVQLEEFKAQAEAEIQLKLDI